MQRRRKEKQRQTYQTMMCLEEKLRQLISTGFRSESMARLRTQSKQLKRKGRRKKNGQRTRLKELILPDACAQPVHACECLFVCFLFSMCNREIKTSIERRRFCTRSSKISQVFNFFRMHTDRNSVEKRQTSKMLFAFDHCYSTFPLGFVALLKCFQECFVEFPMPEGLLPISFNSDDGFCVFILLFRLLLYIFSVSLSTFVLESG